MLCLIKGRRMEIDFAPIVIAFLLSAWALYYFFDTLNQPDGGPQSVLFIKPLVIAVLICFPFVVYSAVKIHPEEKVSGNRPVEEPESINDRGFRDHRRIFFATSLVAYALAITFFGYVIPSILFIFSVVYYLKSRNIWILTVLPIGLVVLIVLIFKVLLTIPIELWPSWSVG